MLAHALGVARGGSPWRMVKSSTKPTLLRTYTDDGKGDPASRDTFELLLVGIAFGDVIIYYLRARRVCRELGKQHRQYDVA